MKTDLFNNLEIFPINNLKASKTVFFVILFNRY